MAQNKQVDEPFVDEFKIEIEFETLGPILADYLLSLELKTIKKITTPSHEEQVSYLVDSYARQLDKILNNYGDDITKDIKESIKCLLVDLEKQVTSQPKHRVPGSTSLS